MKKFKAGRVAAYGLLAIFVVCFSLSGYITLFLPHIPVPDLKIEITPQRVARGNYLANHVTVCIDCHSTRDWGRFSGPVVRGTEGKGGEKFDAQMGFPGTFYSPNITPYSLSGWSDGELFRAITSGVTRDNQPIFPVMPCAYYGRMATEDIYSIVAYLRTLPAIAGKPPKSVANFPVNILLHTMPEKASPRPVPSKSDTLVYGKYLTEAAACIDCHTPVAKNQIIPEKAFSGGREFQMPGGMLRSSNITPDKETGIGQWSKDWFIGRFKSYDLSTYSPGTLDNGALVTIMPWTMYAGMDSTDLAAIYVYLRSVPPLKNTVARWTLVK